MIPGFARSVVHGNGMVLGRKRKSVLRRPKNERPYLLISAGYPAKGCRVETISRKLLDEILVRM